ncbi:hypothetical protein [Paenibacillus odorifer]|uniref:hypothetical protein n=1 Tax=Paenibacillus odorifer TaxID=189426 RepID=UPI00096DAC44|nr:hypothetical protein [Paenibacillus odorifer]OME23390.1 hypothetical protein BSK57_16390 [Paenibacillus odorifer]
MTNANHTLSPLTGKVISFPHNQSMTSVNWLKSTFRDVLRLGGVSALLASLQEEVNRRDLENRERVWNLLLPVARAVIWEEYVRYGETLEVGYELIRSESGELSPYIWTTVTSQPGASAEFYVNPQQNVYFGWDREVRG